MSVCQRNHPTVGGKMSHHDFLLCCPGIKAAAQTQTMKKTKASCHVNECGAHSPGMTYCSLSVMETQEDNNHQN